MKNSFCRALLALIFTPLLCLKIPAQQRALKIGDAIPEAVWTTPLQVVNHSSKTITLDKDRDKLILLDFWATWCSACLKGFPKMEDLQQQFGDKIKIVAVSSQDRPTLEKFFATKNGQRFKNVLSLSGDALLKEMFPHQGVPFIVWIKDGKLLTTTDGEQVNAGNLAQVLTGKTEVLQQVVQLNRDRPLMLSENLELEKAFNLNAYTFFGQGKIRGLGSGSHFHRLDSTVYGRQFYNISLAEIYTAIAGEILQRRGETFNSRQLVSELKDDRLFYNRFGADGRSNPEYLYTLDFIMPPEKAAGLYPAMLTALNAAGPYNGTLEKRNAACYILVRTAPDNKLKTNGGALEFTLRPSGGTVRNAPMAAFVNFLNGQPALKRPVLNETGYSGALDLQLGDISTLPKLQMELARYGLGLREATRSIDMLVMRDAE